MFLYASCKIYTQLPLYIVTFTPFLIKQLRVLLIYQNQRIHINHVKQLKGETTMQKIIPCLWFDGKVEEALKFYTSLFKNSKIKNISHYGEGHPQPGTIMVATFELAGQEFMILNGGPMFKLTEAISLSISCETQEEVDFYWEKLSADGGQESQCGWLKDKYGLSWQIVPTALGRFLRDTDKKRVSNVMTALMQMGKLDIQKLEEAYNQ